MNPRKSLFCLFLLIFMFFYIPAIYAGTVPQFTIMTEEWEPYNFQEDGVVKGISSDLLVLILERIGSSQGRKDIQVLPWARGYRDIQNIPDTLLFSTARTKERENMFKWVGPIFEIDFFIYALRSRNIKISSFEDLRKYKIGTLRCDVVEDMLIINTGMKISDFEQVSLNISNTKKLSLGRVDLIAQSEDTTIYTCMEAGIDPDEFEPVFTLGKANMYYAFHKETPDSVITMFQTAFDDIHNEGKLAEIYNNYVKKGQRGQEAQSGQISTIDK